LRSENPALTEKRSIAYPDGGSRTPLESVRWQRFNPFTAHAGESIREKVMAKGQARSNKEKKKPKAEWNKKKKGGPNLSPFALTREPIQPGQNPFAKKS
jgi:hypothetical protein